MSDLSIYYLQNCGLYLVKDNYGLLIDGLHLSYHGFNGINLATLQKINQHQFPFSPLKAIIFTHKHIDHFDFSLLNQYMSLHPDTILPHTTFIKEKTADLITEDEWTQTIGPFTLYGLEINHLPGPSFETFHQTLLIKTDEKTIFISGDANPVISWKKRDKLRVRPDICFVNPYYLSLTPGRRFLDYLNTNTVWIYHLPSEEKEDFFQYYPLCEEGLKKYPSAFLLKNPSNLPLLLSID